MIMDSERKGVIKPEFWEFGKLVIYLEVSPISHMTIAIAPTSLQSYLAKKNWAPLC